MRKIHPRTLLLLIALTGVLGTFQLSNLAMDYADSTASSNMIVARLLESRSDVSDNGILFFRAKLGISNPARGYVNITYVSYQLLARGDYVAGSSQVFTPNQLVLLPVSSAELRLEIHVPTPESQEVLQTPRQDLQLVIFITTKTKYTMSTLKFTFVP